MSRRKIVFVIVEGPSDEQALGVILSRIYDKNSVFVHIMRCDITTELNINQGNIISRIGDIVRKYASDNHFKNTDFRQIIHITDMDGAFVPDGHIIEDTTVEKPYYTVTGIHTKNKHALEQRNQQKRENLNKLCTTQKIWKVRYQIFYMSCNLDHTLYNKLNTSNEDKEKDSYRFAKLYRNDIPAFWTFISSSDFSVLSGYKQSWDYIKIDLHSLERHSNFGLCFFEEFNNHV